jgi:hypothetical protein
MPPWKCATGKQRAPALNAQELMARGSKNDTMNLEPELGSMVIDDVAAADLDPALVLAVEELLPTGPQSPPRPKQGRRTPAFLAADPCRARLDRG